MKHFAVSVDATHSEFSTVSTAAFLLGLVLFCCCAVARGQSYLTSTGNPPFSAPEPVEFGFTDAANGNLHLEIALGSFPQRGTDQPISLKLVYDSNNLWFVDTSGPSALWRVSSGSFSIPQPYGQVTYATDTNPCDNIVTYKEGPSWTSSTQHTFPPLNVGAPGSGCNTSASAFAADASGFRIYRSQTSTTTIQSIYAPDGTLVNYVNTGGLYRDASGNDIQVVDPNGNYLSTLPPPFSTHNKDLIDTLGRDLGPGASGQVINVPNSQGGTSQYTPTLIFLPAPKTAFGQSGVAECTTMSCGTVYALASLAFPDGSTMSFKYDCDSGTGNAACGSPSGRGSYYNSLIGITLRGGGQVSYTWQVVTDPYSNKHLWAASRTSAGGTWSYSQQTLSTCTSTQVGCKQQVTSTRPNGDKTVYTFTLNNGAWPTTVQQYNASGTVLSTMNTTWDFSQACPWQSCHGASFVRKLSETMTVPIPAGGSLTKQTTYTYDSPQQGHVTAVKEWKFLPGANPSFSSIPDRATYTTYYVAGQNIFRPLTTTVCNSSGTDSDCPGGGGKVAQTKYTYDSYGSGLTLAAGFSNHDDTNYGTGVTIRGNPTQIQEWVSGTTYLTTQNQYDTLGHVLKTIDAASNTTTYGYADTFFNDNGTSQLQTYSPPHPTDGYLTSMTAGGLTQSVGYYFSSGKTATDVDPNGAVTYRHFMDSIDRPTQTNFPIGWTVTTYPSPVEADTFAAVADTSASSNCTSCRQTQYFYDNFGRKVATNLANAPEGSTKLSDTSYDANGRVQSVCHPYVNASSKVCETFAYDGMNRKIATTHPDNQSSRAAFGADVVNLGGFGTQQSSAASYGYGYPVISSDETNKLRQEWIDGFGNVIEVDEPGTGATQSSPGTTSVTVNGSEQSTIISGTSGIGTVTIYGSEQGGTFNMCPNTYPYNCPATIYDGGSLQVTVNGFGETVSWGQGSTGASIASSLASAFNGASGSPVTASVSSNVLTLTAKTTGSTTNYSLSASVPAHNTYFSSPSFSPTPSGSTLSGGQNGGTTYDSGTLAVTVTGPSGNFTASTSYNSSSTGSSLAPALASALSASGSPVSAVANGNTVTITSNNSGSSTNYPFSATASWNSQNFSTASFTVSPGSGSLSGGTDLTMGSPLVTTYTYDAAGRLAQVVQGVQTRTFAYDGIGRATSITTPEAGTDTMAYDADSSCPTPNSFPGHLVKKVDARGIRTCLQYDTLGRLTAKNYSNGQGTVTYQYDQGGKAAFALGRLTQITDPSGSETYTYDTQGAGRVAQIKKVVGTTTYTMGYAYNTGGQVTQTTYPSGRIVQTARDTIGRTSSLSDTLNGVNTTRAGAYSYSPSEKVLGFNYGNGVVASFAYSPTRDQLTGLSYASGATTLFSLNYYYQNDSTNCQRGTTGNDGQIDCVADNTDSAGSGRSIAYTYDPLGRLLTALTKGSSTYPQWGYSWAYDRYGNRLSQTLTAGSGYQNVLSFGNPGGAQTNHPDGMCFDASGNLTAESGACPPVTPMYTYDASNRMTAYSGNSTAAYVYDDNDNRVEKCLPNCTSPTSRTVYIFSSGKDIAEYDNGAAPGSPSREYIYSGQMLLATLAGSTTTYHHSDHVSVRLSTNTSGAKIGEQGHLPYGEAWYSTNTTTKFIFTSYERDAESGNDYAMARYYRVAFGRFCSPDPLAGSPADPQSWNRYVYVRDNPVNTVDPSGMGWLSTFFQWLAGLFSMDIPQSTPTTFPSDSSPSIWQTIEDSIIPPMGPGIIENWSPAAHDQMMWNALHPCGVSNDRIWQIQKASRDFDSSHQGAEWSFAHSMSNGNAHQSAADALAQRDKFENDELTKAQGEYASGNTDAAMKDFGIAMHPVMDSTSPAHVDAQGNPIPWCGYGGCGSVLHGTWKQGEEQVNEHSAYDQTGIERIQDLSAHPEIQDRANSLIRKAYEKMTGLLLTCYGH